MKDKQDRMNRDLFAAISAINEQARKLQALQNRIMALESEVNGELEEQGPETGDLFEPHQGDIFIDCVCYFGVSDGDD